MRLLHMLPTFDTGGLGSLALNLLSAWPRDVEHENFVFAARWQATKPDLRLAFDKLVGAERVREVPRDAMWPMRFVDSAAALKYRGFGNFDGALVYNFFDLAWYTMAARRMGVAGRIVCHVGTVLPLVDVPKAIATSPYTRDVDFVPASRAVRERLLEVGANSAHVLPVRWNGVNFAKFYPRAETEPDGVPLRFGFTGRMAPESKDFEGLLRGWAQWRATEPPGPGVAELLIAGDGPLRDDLVRLVDELGVADSVRFLGNVSAGAMPEFLRTLDVFVMAALPIEGMSMALVEAIATGLPVIASDVPSNREVCEGVEVGMLVPQMPDGYEMGFREAVNERWRHALRRESSLARPVFDVRAVAKDYASLFTG